MYVCVFVYGLLHMASEAHRGWMEVLDVPEMRGTGSYEPPSMGGRNHTLLLHNNSKYS